MRKQLTQQANRKEMTLTLNGHLKVKTCIDPCFIYFYIFNYLFVAGLGGGGSSLIGPFVNGTVRCLFVYVKTN